MNVDGECANHIREGGGEVGGDGIAAAAAAAAAAVVGGKANRGSFNSVSGRPVGEIKGGEGGGSGSVMGGAFRSSMLMGGLISVTGGEGKVTKGQGQGGGAGEDQLDLGSLVDGEVAESGMCLSSSSSSCCCCY